MHENPTKLKRNSYTLKLTNVPQSEYVVTLDNNKLFFHHNEINSDHFVANRQKKETIETQ